jgi:thymidine kinase
MTSTSSDEITFHEIISDTNELNSSAVIHNIQEENRKQLRESYGPHCTIVHRGTLYVRAGPMFSDKTTWLNSELTRFADRGFSVLKITHADDVRGSVAACDDSGSTHNSSYTSLTSKIQRMRAAELKNIDVSKFNVVGIDEGQFFLDLYLSVKEWVNIGKHVRVVGLDGDFKMEKFGQVIDLVPIADEFVKVKASCRVCLDELEKVGFHGNILAIEGPFTKRIGRSNGQKDVGGSDKYMPVCRYHHIN